MKIRTRIYPSGVAKWEVDLGMVGKKRIQKFFDTKKEAETWAATEKKKMQSHELFAAEVDPALVGRFVSAYRELEAVGATIEEAVSFFLERKARVKEVVSLQTLVERALLAKECGGARERYLSSLRTAWLGFSRGREEVLAASIREHDVLRWINGNGLARKSKQIYWGDLRTLFNWGIEHGYLAENPCKVSLKLGRREEHEIESFEVAQVEALLRRAAKEPEPGEEDHQVFVWYVALGMFAGLRPDEMGRLDRSAVNLEEAHVIIGGAQSKTRTRRVVDLSENCLAWLKLSDVREGPVRPVNFKKRWRRLREDAGLLNRTARKGERPSHMPPKDPALRWIHDGMRHSFASYHYAQHQNSALLKAQMGHSEKEDTLMRHYRGVRTKKEAAEFWAIAPEQKKAAVTPEVTA